MADSNVKRKSIIIKKFLSQLDNSSNKYFKKLNRNGYISNKKISTLHLSTKKYVVLVTCICYLWSKSFLMDLKWNQGSRTSWASSDEHPPK